MKLKSMKLSKSDRESASKQAESMIERPAYPYGLCLRLDNEALEKLEIGELPEVGSKMTVLATVEVSATSQHDVAGGSPNKTLELQITDMALGADLDVKDHAAALYDKS